MMYYEGLVEGLTRNGRAKVVIRPDKLGISGAPEVSAKVCHCATDGSTVRITAVNKVNARVGDWVSVGQKPGVFLTNAANLLGIPLLGVVSGYVAGGILTGGFLVQSTIAAISVVTGLALGVLVGVYRYKRGAAENLPVVGQIVRSHEGTASLDDNSRFHPGTDQGDGELCAVSR